MDVDDLILWVKYDDYIHYLANELHESGRGSIDRYLINFLGSHNFLSVRRKFKNVIYCQCTLNILAVHF